MSPEYITIHCSATRPETPFSVESLRYLHVEVNNWSDIGYHFYITQDGLLHTCRSLDKTGAHVKGHNKNNIGICLEGGLDNDTGKPVDNFTDVQNDTLRYLITELQSNYGVVDDNVKGHRDWYPDLNGDGILDRRDWLKECPCFDIAEKRKSWG